MGMEYLFMDNLEMAKESFIKCLEEDFEDQSALYNVVYCFEFLDQNQEAITYLNQYIDKNPYSEIAWHQMGRLHYGLKEYEEAIRAFDYATLIDDEFLGAFMERAKALERLKKYEEAIESYNRTIELDDATSYALLRIGKCYEKLGNKVLGFEIFQQNGSRRSSFGQRLDCHYRFLRSSKKLPESLVFCQQSLGHRQSKSFVLETLCHHQQTNELLRRSRIWLPKSSRIW